MAGPKKVEERREATIRALWASIARYGTEGTTIDGVARIAGFSKGVIHYYFDSKKDLLLAAFQAFLEAYDTEILAALSALGREPEGSEVLEAIIASTLPPFFSEDIEAAELPVLKPGEALSPRYKARLFIQFFPLAMNDRDFAARVKESYDRQGAAIAECFASLAPAAAPEASLAAAAGLMALIDGFSFHRVLGYLPEGLPEHAELARRLVKTLSALK
jgi:TetR/AcrR family transcriptional regulator, transcriptional repressor of bet genes